MWVQHVSEGQINEPTQEGDDSGESNPPEPYVLVEGIPDELGHEWRMLHPFEIPGVRFPTDITPPNQRRLAENDALVDRGIIDFISQDMVTLFIEEEEEVEVEEEEEEIG